jgi:hypothetical protein
MPDLYRDKYDNVKANAQDNLCGRTHFVDDATLRWHNSRVCYASSQYGGWLFAVIVTDPAIEAAYKEGGIEHINVLRGYRYQIFDVFGTTVARVPVDQLYETRKACEAAMLADLAGMDPAAITRKGIEHSEYWHRREMADLETKLREFKGKAA